MASMIDDGSPKRLDIAPHESSPTKQQQPTTTREDLGPYSHNLSPTHANRPKISFFFSTVIVDVVDVVFES